MTSAQYPSYRVSSLPFLGQVPSHWQERRLKTISPFITVGIVVNPSDYVSEEGHPFIYGGDIMEGQVLFETSRRISDEDSRKNSKTRLQAGDLLTVRVGAPGVTAVVPEACNGGNCASVMLVRKGNYCSTWLCYAMNSRMVRFQVEVVQYGAAQEQFNIGHAINFWVATPPTKEQEAIAAFLDRETAKIDALIAEQEKLRALLAEKRQAAISHAVTRGLNPGAPMKDSGIAWLGAVPAHWAVIRIKHAVASIEQGWSPQCENFPVSSPDEWGVLKVGCVNGGVFQPAENKKLPPELEPIPAYSLKQGDLLISRANTRELVGSAAVVEADFDNLLLCDKLYRLRLDGTQCTPTYLAAYLGTPHARLHIEMQATGASSSMLNIGQSAILDLIAPMPSISEQNDIRQFLAEETKRLDALNTRAEQAISLLKERRSALISAAVTGQIDVRQA